MRIKWFPSEALFSIFGSVMSGFGIKISAVFFLNFKTAACFFFNWKTNAYSKYNHIYYL
jgi:hypothetical protein